MERDIQANFRLDWPQLIASAKGRRRQLKLTQRRLAAVAGVSLPTVVSFEAGGDVRLSSAFRILDVLDMTAKPIEGTLRIRADGAVGSGPFSAMYLPYSGSHRAMEQYRLSTRGELEKFLNEIGVEGDARSKIFAELPARGVSDIVNLILNQEQLRRVWTVQFAVLRETTPG